MTLLLFHSKRRAAQRLTEHHLYVVVTRRSQHRRRIAPCNDRCRAIFKVNFHFVSIGSSASHSSQSCVILISCESIVDEPPGLQLQSVSPSSSLGQGIREPVGPTSLEKRFMKQRFEKDDFGKRFCAKRFWDNDFGKQKILEQKKDLGNFFFRDHCLLISTC